MSKLLQIDKLIEPQTCFEGENVGDAIDQRQKEHGKWLTFILNFTKRTEAGKWNDKYGVMIFKANYGYHSAMKRIVEDCVREMKKTDPDLVVMDESDENRVRTWTIGKPDSIKQMVEDELYGKSK